MDIEPKEEKQAPSTNPKASKKTNRDLLRFERPIYEIKKSSESEQEYVIRKLMDRRPKPEIGIIQKSPLLTRMRQMMPIFKKSNQQLLNSQIKVEQRIDLQLEQVQDSSSESESDKENQMKEQSEQAQIINSHFSSLENPKIKNIESCGELQINILRYPYEKTQQNSSNSEKSDEQDMTDPTGPEQTAKQAAKIVEIGQMISKLNELQ